MKFFSFVNMKSHTGKDHMNKVNDPTLVCNCKKSAYGEGCVGRLIVTMRSSLRITEF
jgi:hypothetical protein